MTEPDPVLVSLQTRTQHLDSELSMDGTSPGRKRARKPPHPAKALTPAPVQQKLRSPNTHVQGRNGKKARKAAPVPPPSPAVQFLVAEESLDSRGSLEKYWGTASNISAAPAPGPIPATPNPAPAPAPAPAPVPASAQPQAAASAASRIVGTPIGGGGGLHLIQSTLTAQTGLSLFTTAIGTAASSALSSPVAAPVSVAAAPASTPVVSSPMPPVPAASAPSDELRAVREALAACQAKLYAAEDNVRHAHLAAAAATEAKDALAAQVSALLSERQSNVASEAAIRPVRMSSMEALLRELVVQVVGAQRRNLAEQQYELGHITVIRTSPTSTAEAWEDGQAFAQLRLRNEMIVGRKEELEKRKKNVAKAVRKAGGDAEGKTAKANVIDDEDALAGLAPLEGDEIIRAQLNEIKREEANLAEDLKRLESRKAVLLREMKRVRDEDQSRFAKRPVLNDRYMLLFLLGKGGFSEVWRAFDLVEAKEVAVKLHQLAPYWSESRKQSYIKHVTREYSIHKALNHPRVVRLFDVFEIDVNAFATVLELCRGTDLDHVLKERTTLPEREARAILMQVLSALRYLHGRTREGEASQPNRIIHYDLKPGNILLDDSHGVKVTDFGLSKILSSEDDSAAATSMALTSHGAGTYWYLPPECFAGQESRISDKVDVWSLGIIYYEMLFGKRPFGDGQSQDKILADSVILRATQVPFPAKPAVSAEAKAFIQRCLTANVAMRPDVGQVCEDPYLKLRLK